ncbi:unnamed protein product [Prunus armeniaca]|uniref:Uncharacterized protein n=1 Tax=Prunus armeniaca TaxID=36596 RepID=A0A6J5Y2E4_PRUAR|nr:unnamed protein product [Prunus armeniaca]
MGEMEHYGITALGSSSSEEDQDDLKNNEESVAAMRKRLNEQRKEIQTRRSGIKSTVCIYRVPPSLNGISPTPETIEPEMVSIGPYHRGKDELLEFESYKLQFLNLLLSRETNGRRHDLLPEYYKAMKKLEESTRSRYSESIPMSSPDFVEMMVLDGCFIIELFQRMSADEDDHPILTRPWLIPILTRDLLKLQNQLPFFVLEKLFEISNFRTEHSLTLLALEFFNHTLPRPSEVLKRTSNLRGAKHLLDLFHLSFLPPFSNEPPRKKSIFQRTSDVLCEATLKTLIWLCMLFISSTPHDDHDADQNYRPSSESIQCTTQLRPSGIKFRPRKAAESFLDINFRNGVLQIPPITINDLTIAVFINCMAFERCHQYTSQLFTTYIAFMSCLINSTRDVTLLCADGIITGFSQNDQNVAELFTKLGEKVVFDIRKCYLSTQFRDVEAYYSSHWATFMRTYFSKPWSFISVFSAFILLVLTGAQTAMAILCYINKR